MDNQYDTKFLYDTLFLLQTHIEDLSTWSVYNDDSCLDEIHELKKKFEQVRKLLFQVGKQIDEQNEQKGGEQDGY